MNYDYSYYSDLESMAFAGGIVAVVLVIYLLALAFQVVSYVLQALGMYSIAKRRGIRKPWLAWIPVVNVWLLGSISDQYQYVVKGKVRNRRGVLLGLQIAMYALAVVAVIAMSLSAAVPYSAPSVAGVAIVIYIVCWLAAAALTVTAAVFQYIALYDLYISCVPDNAVLYLVLSILVNVTLPFFVFACRKKDLGMPPRKAPQPAAPVIAEPAAAPEAEEEVPETTAEEPAEQPEEAPAEKTAEEE